MATRGIVLALSAFCYSIRKQVQHSTLYSTVRSTHEYILSDNPSNRKTNVLVFLVCLLPARRRASDIQVCTVYFLATVVRFSCA